MVDEVLHERAVVADEDDRALVGAQEALEPRDRLEVEVVGRLVEQQHVGLAQQQLREREAHLPAAGELVGEPLEVRLLEAEAEEHRARVGLDRVAAERLEAVVQPPVLGEEALLLLARLGWLRGPRPAP